MSPEDSIFNNIFWRRGVCREHVKLWENSQAWSALHQKKAQLRVRCEYIAFIQRKRRRPFLVFYDAGKSQLQMLLGSPGILPVASIATFFDPGRYLSGIPKLRCENIGSVKPGDMEIKFEPNALEFSILNIMSGGVFLGPGASNSIQGKIEFTDLFGKQWQAIDFKSKGTKGKVMPTKEHIMSKYMGDFSQILYTMASKTHYFASFDKLAICMYVYCCMAFGEPIRLIHSKTLEADDYDTRILYAQPSNATNHFRTVGSFTNSLSIPKMRISKLNEVEANTNNENSGINNLLNNLTVENITNLKKQEIVTEILGKRPQFRRWFQTRLHIKIKETS